MDKNLQSQSKASATRTLPMGTKMDCGGKTNRYSEKPSLRINVPGHNEEASNKCYQCDNASPYAVSLRTHLKMHSVENSNKCNQCDYASSRAGHLRSHLKTHSGEKLNKCNHCCKQAI